MSIRPAENSTLDIRHVIGIGTPKAVDLWLDVVTELPDRARELGSLSKAELGKLGPLLDGTNAVELFESIDDKLAAEALHAMDPSLAAPSSRPSTPTTPPTSCANSRSPSGRRC